MERHLLLTVGDDLSSLHGIRFAGSFFKDKSNMKLTLLYVAPVSESAHGPGIPPHRKMDQGLSGSSREKGQQAIEESRRLLVFKGFPEESIDFRLVGKRFGTVKDIIHEGQTGHYDAVVLGRRGFAMFEKSFATSVSREMLEQRITFPLWICKRPEEGRKDVLLCVDESEPSKRIADHVGFMIQNEDHTVTLFHADDGEGKDADAILAEAKQKLLENRIPEQRIRIQIVRTTRVASAILEEVERGSYAAVAVGRGGSQPMGLIKKWIAGGSRSTKLMESLDKAVLWVSK